VIEHLNALNIVVSKLLSVEIKISYEDKCIALLFSLLDSWDSLIVAIGSNTNILSFDDVVSCLLLEDMRRKNMEGQSTNALFVRGHSQERNRYKSSSGRFKSKGRSKFSGNFVKVCWRCGKDGHYKKQCIYKIVERGKGSEDAPSRKEKISTEEGGDVYLDSSSTHTDHEAWLVDSGTSFHMTPHMESFYEYERYDGGDVSLGDESTTKIIGRGKFKLKLMDGRIITFPGVLHIPGLTKNLIYVSKMDDAREKQCLRKKPARWFKEQWCC
jgi:hypothetical protein